MISHDNKTHYNYLYTSHMVCLVQMKGISEPQLWHWAPTNYIGGSVNSIWSSCVCYKACTVLPSLGREHVHLTTTNSCLVTGHEITNQEG